MRPRATAVLAAAGVIAAIALCALVFRSVAVEAAYPVERAANFFSRQVWTRIAGCFQGAAARAENVRLRREVAELLMERGEYARLREENARLLALLGYAERMPGRWVPAAVLSQGGGAANARPTIRVDKGSLAGITTNAVVAVPSGLVGRVLSVTLHTAEILLVTGERMNVACEIETGAVPPPRGFACGCGTGCLALRHLTDKTTVPVRSRVVTSGLGGVYPRGLEIGVCVEENVVLPSVDFRSLTDVLIRCREK